MRHKSKVAVLFSKDGDDVVRQLVTIGQQELCAVVIHTASIVHDAKLGRFSCTFIVTEKNYNISKTSKICMLNNITSNIGLRVFITIIFLNNGV